MTLGDLENGIPCVVRRAADGEVVPMTLKPTQEAGELATIGIGGPQIADAVRRASRRSKTRRPRARSSFARRREPIAEAKRSCKAATRSCASATCR